MNQSELRVRNQGRLAPAGVKQSQDVRRRDRREVGDIHREPRLSNQLRRVCHLICLPAIRGGNARGYRSAKSGRAVEARPTRHDRKNLTTAGEFIGPSENRRLSKAHDRLIGQVLGRLAVGRCHYHVRRYEKSVESLVIEGRDINRCSEGIAAPKREPLSDGRRLVST